MERFRLPNKIKAPFVHTYSQKELDELGNSQTAIDHRTRDAGGRLAAGRVLIAGAIHDHMDGMPAEFGQQLGKSSISIREEGQQASEYKTAVALAHESPVCTPIIPEDMISAGRENWNASLGPLPPIVAVALLVCH